jgi:hypothetical protein
MSSHTVKRMWYIHIHVLKNLISPKLRQNLKNWQPRLSAEDIFTQFLDHQFGKIYKFKVELN